MAKLEDIVAGVRVEGPLLPEPVEVIATVPMGASTKLIAKGLRTKAIKDEFEKGAGIDRVYFPDKTADIADRAVLTLAVMGPDRAIAEPGSQSLIEVMSREHGQSSRVFKSAIVWSAPEDAGTLRDEARKLLAWDDILGDRDELKLDEAQIKQLKENVAKSRSYVREAVWQTYKNVFLLDDDNRLRRIDLGKIHSSAAPTIVDLFLGRLRQEDLLTDVVSLNTLVRNWPPALPEWSTKALRDAFYASPKFPRLSTPDIVKSTIARGVSDDQLAYGARRGDRYEPFLYGKPLAGADVDIAEDVIVLRKQDAERIQQAIEAGKPAKPSSAPRRRPNEAQGRGPPGAARHHRPSPRCRSRASHGRASSRGRSGLSSTTASSRGSPRRDSSSGSSWRSLRLKGSRSRTCEIPAPRLRILGSRTTCSR